MLSPRVWKAGGRVLADPDSRARFAAIVAGCREPVILVHGGGAEIGALCGRLGITEHWREGLRVTTAPVLDAAVMALSGRVNKALVAALAVAGVDAVGLSGEDGALLVARQAADPALGRVGTEPDVRVELLNALLGLGLVPVISPISRSAGGGRLNVNADEAAAAIAAAVGASELHLLTDVAGVKRAGTTISRLTPSAADALIEAGTARDGMAVKLEAATRAVEAGVGRVAIGPLNMSADPSVGTRVGTELGGVA